MTKKSEKIKIDYYDIEIDENYQDAVVGVVERFGEEPSPLYKTEKLSSLVDNLDEFEGYQIFMYITMDEIANLFPETLCYPEFDDDVIGMVEKRGQKPVILYNREAVIERLAKDMEDSEDPYMDAIEHFEFNVIGGYIGDTTPAFGTIY